MTGEFNGRETTRVFRDDYGWIDDIVIDNGNCFLLSVRKF